MMILNENDVKSPKIALYEYFEAEQIKVAGEIKEYSNYETNKERGFDYPTRWDFFIAEKWFHVVLGNGKYFVGEGRILKES